VNRMELHRNVNGACAALLAVRPISDVRASAEYRREMSAVLSRRALEACIAQAAAEIALAVRPISDVRASAGYRREMSAVLSRRALEACIAQAGGVL